MNDFKREVATIRALLYLDLADPRAIIQWAAGLEPHTEGLAHLAELTTEMPDVRREEVGARLAVLAEELGLEPLTERVAGIAAAEEAARELARGTLTPIAAARRIWRIATLAPSAEPQLRTFIGLASEWEDDPANRSYYEEEIRSRALRLQTEEAT